MNHLGVWACRPVECRLASTKQRLVAERHRDVECDFGAAEDDSEWNRFDHRRATHPICRPVEMALPEAVTDHGHGSVQSAAPDTSASVNVRQRIAGTLVDVKLQLRVEIVVSAYGVLRYFAVWSTSAMAWLIRCHSPRSISNRLRPAGVRA
jgi:hypothetical protein